MSKIYNKFSEREDSILKYKSEADDDNCILCKKEIEGSGTEGFFCASCNILGSYCDDCYKISDFIAVAFKKDLGSKKSYPWLTPASDVIVKMCKENEDFITFMGDDSEDGEDRCSWIVLENKPNLIKEEVKSVLKPILPIDLVNIINLYIHNMPFCLVGKDCVDDENRIYLWFCNICKSYYNTITD